MSTTSDEGSGPLIEISLRTELSRAGLIALRQRIDDLLEGLPENPPAQTPGSEAELAEKKARAAWDRLGTTTRDYLAACARLAGAGKGFSIDDVATEMGVEHSKALAYHRNVMRTAATAEPRDVALITSSRNAGRTQLSITKTVSSALLKLANQGTE
jgi:hypothetical protein